MSTLSPAFAFLNARYEWQTSKLWRPLTGPGRLLGDCVRYVLTIGYLYYHGYLPMMLAMIKGEFKVHRFTARDDKGDHTVLHCVGQIGDEWFDCWTKAPLSRKAFDEATGHHYVYKRNPFVTIYRMAGIYGRVALGLLIAAGVLGLIRGLS